MTDPVREALAEPLLDALQRIEQWVDAYPLDIFPEPDFKRVREGLATVGITVDAVSASNMRHVLTGISKIAKPAISEYLVASAALAQEPCRASVDVVQTLPVPDDAVPFQCVCCRQTHYMAATAAASLLRRPLRGDPNAVPPIIVNKPRGFT